MEAQAMGGYRSFWP